MAKADTYVRTLREVLESRLGRRLVLRFLACALAPLALFAWLLHGQMSSDLERDAESTLHLAARSAAMNIAHRLRETDVDLDIACNHLREHGAATFFAAPSRSRTWLQERFPYVGVGAPSRPAACLGAVPAPVAEPTAGERQLLATGRMVLRAVPRPAGGCDLLAIRPLRADEPEGPLVTALLPHDTIFAPDDLQILGAEVFVLAADGVVLHANLQHDLTRTPLQQAFAHEQVSATFAWDLDGEAQVGHAWQLFLQPRYGTDWTVVLSLPRACVFAPLWVFRQWFLGIATAAGLGVFALSLAMIRRTLTPVARLHRATQRLAAGDFTTGDHPHGDDELGDLGRAFDGMARTLDASIRARTAAERELAAAAEQALAAADARSAFLANVSHELRTPLTAIVSGAEILRDYGGDDPAVRAEFVGVIGKQANRLLGQIEDILALTTDATWQPQPTHLLDSLHGALARLPAATQARVQLDTDDTNHHVLGDHDRLVELWGRLLDNALKFSPPDQPVRVQVQQVGERCHVAVADRGPGIAKPYQAELFVPFRQAGHDVLTDKPAGTGVGLAICQRIVQRLGGRIRVDSAPGQGATFTVELPVASVAQPLVGAAVQ